MLKVGVPIAIFERRRIFGCDGLSELYVVRALVLAQFRPAISLTCPLTPPLLRSTIDDFRG